MCAIYVFDTKSFGWKTQVRKQHILLEDQTDLRISFGKCKSGIEKECAHWAYHTYGKTKEWESEWASDWSIDFTPCKYSTDKIGRFADSGSRLRLD